MAQPVRFNTAILLDTHSVFHGVDRLAETTEPVDRLRPGMRLRFAGDGIWQVMDGEEPVTRYRWDELRFSVSWKAYCFADESERRAWREHADDLSVAEVVERLLEDMRARGVVGDERPSDVVLVELIIDTYVRFPQPARAA